MSAYVRVLAPQVFLKTLQWPMALMEETSSISVSSIAAVSVISPVSIWSTVRFRRAKDKKGWALLGIPAPLYPTVAFRLFELRGRLISRHEEGGFISVLFEGPPALAARLAQTFPAPPGCEALKVAASGDRILSGKAAKSPRAIAQAFDPQVLESVVA
ncbi:MAG: hypothetical protein AAFV72_02755 [Cyanobacteria bacterium J06635_1]